MKILVTNDDGVNSPGLWAVVDALCDMAEVVVVAPDRDQSGVGTALTLRAPVRATKVTPFVDGVITYSVEGTPADSVVIALEQLVGQVDLVVAGINIGANLGSDVLLSGTVGAAFQGYHRAIPSVAISVTSLHATHFKAATQILKVVARMVAEDALPRSLLLNINVPAVPLEEIAGIEVTRLAGRSYTETVRDGDDGKRSYYWITRSKADWKLEAGLDTWAIHHRMVSITPLYTDITARRNIGALKELPPQIHSALRTE